MTSIPHRTHPGQPAHPGARRHVRFQVTAVMYVRRAPRLNHQQVFEHEADARDLLLRIQAHLDRRARINWLSAQQRITEAEQLRLQLDPALSALEAELGAQFDRPPRLTRITEDELSA